MPDKIFSIGDLARAEGCKVQTIRHYEQVGLMPPPPRTLGNQRRYGPAQLARLGFIRHGRELGFSLPAIQEMLALSDDPNRTCEEVDAIARHQLADVEIRIRRLQGLRRELQRMVRDCEGGRVGDCRILEVLSDHSHRHCLSDGHD